jgi:hypothetical protein
VTRSPEAVKLGETMRAAIPKKKATKPIHPYHPESAWFDPINLGKKRVGENSEGKQRQTESWHSFSTF